MNSFERNDGGYSVEKFEGRANKIANKLTRLLRKDESLGEEEAREAVRMNWGSVATLRTLRLVVANLIKWVWSGLTTPLRIAVRRILEDRGVWNDHLWHVTRTAERGDHK